jgi:hypothetical protein
MTDGKVAQGKAHPGNGPLPVPESLSYAILACISHTSLTWHVREAAGSLLAIRLEDVYNPRPKPKGRKYRYLFSHSFMVNDNVPLLGGQGSVEPNWR